MCSPGITDLTDFFAARQHIKRVHGLLSSPVRLDGITIQAQAEQTAHLSFSSQSVQCHLLHGPDSLTQIRGGGTEPSEGSRAVAGQHLGEGHVLLSLQVELCGVGI